MSACAARRGLRFRLAQSALPLALLLGLAPLSTSMAPAQDPTLTLDLEERTRQEPLLPGFTKGFELPGRGDSPAPSLPDSLAALRPGFWRIGSFDLYPAVARFSPKVAMSLQGLYFKRHGSFGVRPWQRGEAGVDEWRRFCAEQVRLSKQRGVRVDYWEVWNEPDNPQFHGSWSELLELYRSAINSVHSVDPNARVVGPNITDFDRSFSCRPDDRCTPPDQPQTRGAPHKGLFDFLHDLSRPPYQVRLDAISWHEFEEPAQVVRDAERLRKFLSDPGRFDTPYRAELHLAEYQNSITHVLPGFAVGFIDAAERARLSWITRSCWDVAEPGAENWSTCHEGLNGLYLRNLRGKQVSYYVYEAYARIAGRDRSIARVATHSSSPYVSALAGVEPDGTALALIGVHGYAQEARSAVAGGPLRIAVRGYPSRSGTAHVQVRRLAHSLGRHEGVARVGAASPPERLMSQDALIRGGVLRFSLEPRARWGEAYWIEISPPVEESTSQPAGGPPARQPRDVPSSRYVHKEARVRR